MNDDTLLLRDRLIEVALPGIPFDGWSRATLESAAAAQSIDPAMVNAVFPGGKPDIMAGFADWADRRMMARLAATDPAALRVRDRIALAVRARFDALAPHKEAARMAAAYWAAPFHAPHAAAQVWRTADRIWDWAGDTATDYNRYTKRTLLSGILASATMAWLGDEGRDMQKTYDFIDRRIEETLKIGRLIGTILPGRKNKAS